MIGVLVRYTILEKDIIKDDVIWVRKLIINDDIHTDGKITITENLFNEGADLGYVDSDSEKQNYYIKVEAYAGRKESSTFELSFESVEFEVGKSPVKVEVGKKKEEEKKEEEPLEEGACPHCRKKHIDLTGSVTFFGYRDSDKKGCFRRCQDMLNSCGYKSVSVKDPSVFQMTKCDECESKNKHILINQPNIQKGIQIIDDHLERGIPIVVGVDHSSGHTGNHDKTTDHWILIVGRQCNKKIEYLFFDPQTSNKDRGTSKNNVLILQEDNSLKGIYKNKTYIVTMVRPSIIR